MKTSADKANADALRVHLTYDVATGGLVEKRELPFVIGVFADLYALKAADDQRAPLKSCSWIGVSADNLDGVLKNFQPTEMTRTGLRYLVDQLHGFEFVRIQVLNVSKPALLQDFQKCGNFDASVVFDRVYEKSYGVFGGEPISLIVGDCEFGHSADDISLLGYLSQVAAVSLAPFLCAAHAGMFLLDSFAQLDRPRTLDKIFENSECDAWNTFRESEASRSVCLAVPPATFDTENGASLASFNTAYVVASRMGKAFGKFNWPAMFNGFDDEGFRPEVEISVERARELNALGFLAVCNRTGSTETAVVGVQSAYRPKRYVDPAEDLKSQQGATLPALLIASRFAHYVQVIMRNQIGSILTRDRVQTLLNQWLSQYVLLDADAELPVQAQFPLRAAAVCVTQTAGSPGSYDVRLQIQPHYQMPWLESSLDLSWTMAKP